MGSSRDNKARKGKSATSKGLDLPTTKQPSPTSDSSRSINTPATTHGRPMAEVATPMDTVARTLVTSNASNIQTTPRKPVRRPHEGSVIPNISRTKPIYQAPAVKSGTQSKIDRHPVDEPEPSKVKSEQAKDDESDEIESLFSAYRPVEGIGAVNQSSTKPLTRGLNPIGLVMASAALTASNISSEASKRTVSTFKITGVEDALTRANKAVASIEDPTSIFDVPRATAANPDSTRTPPPPKELVYRA